MTYEPERNGRPTVLVVEDHDDTRFMLRMILEHDGYVMLEAADGLEGIEMAISQHPDLVLMDGSLPKLDGLSAARRMREQESLRDVPIVTLSGHDGPEFQAAARRRVRRVHHEAARLRRVQEYPQPLATIVFTRCLKKK
jgi:CheY-like chemotaxis protein